MNIKEQSEHIKTNKNKDEFPSRKLTTVENNSFDKEHSSPELLDHILSHICLRTCVSYKLSIKYVNSKGKKDSLNVIHLFIIFRKS